MRGVAAHTPIQYIVGHSRFCGLDLLVDDRVLIPRPETEMLVDEVCMLVRRTAYRVRRIKILDLCAGSGNIAVSIAHKIAQEELRDAALTKERCECTIIASDVSDGALEVARANARRHGLERNIGFVKSDLFDDIDGIFDIVVTNPPYIAGPEFSGLEKHVLMEPRAALYGGEDGLDFYRRILRSAPGHLARGGVVAMEIGYGQLGAVSAIAGDCGFAIEEVRKDFNGIDRVVVTRWTSL